VQGVARAMGNLEDIADQQKVPNPVALHMPPVSSEMEMPGIFHQKLELKPIPGIISDPQLMMNAINLTERDAMDKVIDDSLKSFGALTGSLADDRKLTDWLVAEYKKPI
jgi:hypothetical protein